MIIYKITCKINNKVYIGQTSESIMQRFRRHMGYQKDEHDTKFYRAIRKYGTENFYIEEIDSANSQDELDEKEMYWISKYNSINNGYNTKESKGKCGGDTISNHPNKTEICKKISDSKKGDRNPMRIHGGLKGVRNGMFGKTPACARKCVAINEKTHEVLFFDTLKDLKETLNVTTIGMVTKRCQGGVKSPYNGYYLKYYEDYVKSQSTIESVTQEKDLCE